MNKEEKEAIKSLKNIAENAVEYDYLNWEEIDAVKTILNLIQKQSKIINAMRYRVVLTEEEHQMILKMLDKRFNKRYEDCVVEYFKKEVEKE